MRVKLGKIKQTYRSFQCLTQRKNTKNYGKTLAASVKRLGAYLADFQDCFQNKTKKFFDKAESYAHGVFISSHRNIERICEDQSDMDYYQMQHFITHSNWNERKVIDRFAFQVSKSLPKRKLTGLIVDETGTVKKGDMSVGVSWQYCGNVGKLANSQVVAIKPIFRRTFGCLKLKQK